ncbi:MAG: hypothetical protein V4581_00425 [Bacteroidota bacterium]
MKYINNIKSGSITLLILLLVSCSGKVKEKFIYYTHNNITVTRLDRDNTICFYYGKFTDENKLPKSYIKASYHGFNSGVDAYLIMEKDKPVKILSMMGIFDTINGSKDLKLVDIHNNVHFEKWKERVGKNKCRVHDIISGEIETNKQYPTDIIAIYPN